VLAALFSERYPAIGESHGLSAVAGTTRNRLGCRLESLTIVDKVTTGVEDCSDIVDAIRSSNANILGIAIQYGTFSVLKREYQRLRSAITEVRPLVVFGGALATYLGDDLLEEVDESAVIIEGEGDAAFPEIVLNWLDGVANELTPNVRLQDKYGRTRVGPRTLGDLTTIEPPSRDHIPEIVRSGGQIYLESSRGCSWAACTFCLRGLTDVKGRSIEHRRFPQRRLFADICTLQQADVSAATFADEDFLGGPIQVVSSYMEELARHLSISSSPFTFDASTTIDSVLGLRDSTDEAEQRQSMLRNLKEAGLRKIFLGIESGSSTQLRRYAKGHRPDHCAAAVRRLRDLQIEVEIGFIMFDPLCTIDEIAENLSFLHEERLADAVSYLMNEMRLQRGSTYIRLLEREESKRGEKLYERQVDRDTLSYKYKYIDPGVRSLAAATKRCQEAANGLLYPLKALSRYADRGALEDAAGDVRAILARVREAQFVGLSAAVEMLQGGVQAQPHVVYPQYVVPALERAAADFSSCLNRPAKYSSDRHPVISRTLAIAKEVEGGALRKLYSQQEDVSGYTDQSV
jgi:radical SAM superfamily enzyme YgiQ (UPF0313 family)